MGNSCQRGYCSSWETRRRMAQMSENERIAILDDNSMGAGGVIFIYRIFLYLTIVGSLVTNLALQRDPVAGPDPAVARFNALPHVIWVVLPLIALALAERARLFSPARSYMDMIRRLGFAIALCFVALLGEVVHWIALLIEGVTCTSPLCISSTTYPFMWTLFAFVTVQFLLCLWLIGRLFVLRTNAWAYRDLMIRSGKQRESNAVIIQPSAPSLQDLENGPPPSEPQEEDEDEFDRGQREEEEGYVSSKFSSKRLPFGMDNVTTGIANVGEIVFSKTSSKKSH